MKSAADVSLTDVNMQGAGIIVGRQEDGNLENCAASGSVTAPDGGYSIGGLAGHSGTFENGPTLVENGTVKNVSIETGENSERIGGITGGGFYSPMYKEYYPEPAKSEIKSCAVSEFTVSGGKYVGTAVGYSYGTTAAFLLS